MVDVEWGRASAEALRSAGFTAVALNEYPGMGHTVSDDELRYAFGYFERTRQNRVKM